MNRKFFRIAGVAALALLACTPLWAQQDVSPEVMQQIAAISAAKAAFTPAQKKMDSRLAFGALAAANDARVASFRGAIAALDAAGVRVQISGDINADLLAAIAAVNGVVESQAAQWGVMVARLPVAALEGIAARPDVKSMRTPSQAHTNVGTVTSQGYIAHEANKVAALGYTGAGVTVGVLSDSAQPATIAALIASGDLPPGTHALPGEDGSEIPFVEDEGTAMMEIIHDMAPGASLIFATAFHSDVDFANNILGLAAAGAKVIVDDVSYSGEGVFQDTVIAQAINQVTAAGVIYFSSAANSGNLTHGTSGTWEGDFLNGGAVSGVVGTFEGGAGSFHNFGTVGSPQNFNVLAPKSPFDDYVLYWSDPFGGSSNDYDFFLLNSAGTVIKGFSASSQTGTQDPVEEIYVPGGSASGDHLVVVLFSGSARALHIDTERGGLTIATSGATIGHNAAANTVSMAATYWNSAKTGTVPFTGAANPTEPFSSDGPRKIFYNPNGTPITPGNFLFGTNGGTTLQKPDLAAANGGSTLTPGFNPFFGTSASAPHAAAIAALILQAKPSYTVAQIKTAMTASALDSMAPGIDRDSGYGIAMGLAAVQYALTH